jgi:hypothetical protein
VNVYFWLGIGLSANFFEIAAGCARANVFSNNNGDYGFPFRYFATLPLWELALISSFRICDGLKRSLKRSQLATLP